MIYNCYLTCALLPFLVSAISGFIFTPQIISFCLKRKLYDLPNERKVHHSAIPRLGGVAFLPCMLLAFLVAMLVLSILLFRNEGVDTVTNLEGGIIGLTGEYAGARIPVGKTPVVIGRDQNSSNVILQDNRISRQHCSVVYDASRKIYIVRDFSSNGTFLEDGSRLKPNQINELPPGTKIRVGDNSTFVLK